MPNFRFALLLLAVVVLGCDDTAAVEPERACLVASNPPRDLLPPDASFPTTFSYRAYSSPPTAPGSPSSSSSYFGTATATGYSDCIDGVRQVFLTGTVHAARTTDGGDPVEVSGPLTLGFRVSDSEVTVTYVDPFIDPPTGDSFVLGPFPRISDGAAPEIFEDTLSGCSDSDLYRVRFLPGVGFLGVATSCTERDSESGDTSAGVTLSVQG